jgi:hypothetical protein
VPGQAGLRLVAALSEAAPGDYVGASRRDVDAAGDRAASSINVGDTHGDGRYDRVTSTDDHGGGDSDCRPWWANSEQ